MKHIISSEHVCPVSITKVTSIDMAQQVTNLCKGGTSAGTPGPCPPPS